MPFQVSTLSPEDGAVEGDTPLSSIEWASRRFPEILRILLVTSKPCNRLGTHRTHRNPRQRTASARPPCLASRRPHGTRIISSNPREKPCEVGSVQLFLRF